MTLENGFLKANSNHLWPLVAVSSVLQQDRIYKKFSPIEQLKQAHVETHKEEKKEMWEVYVLLNGTHLPVLRRSARPLLHCLMSETRVCN